MMPKTTTVPPGLRPFLFHGLDLSWLGGGPEAVGRCPFCRSESEKFYVNVETTEWNCRRGDCGAKGNAQSFLRQLHEVSMPGDTLPPEYSELAKDRGLLDPRTLASWGVCLSRITDEWLVPGYSASGVLRQLYRYTRVEGRMLLLPTPGFGHWLLGPTEWAHDKAKTVYVCEGPWDGMALWETMASARVVAEPTAFDTNGHKTVLGTTADRSKSLLSTCAVLAAPSCNVFHEKWCPALSGKAAVFLFDSDYPRTDQKTGAAQAPAGFSGVKRACEVLSTSEEPPSGVSYLKWGPAGYDPQEPDGYDVRDFLTKVGTNLSERVKALGKLLCSTEPIPAEWLEGRSAEARKNGQVELTTKPCNRWVDLKTAWRLTFKWTDGLDRALSCMMATVISTKAVGDQLWMKIIGPPSCGKSVLCEALSVSKKYVKATSSIRGFHSGYKVDAEGSEDVSLLAQCRDKTLVVKDGDTLIQSPNLSLILSEARDIYDRVSRTHYRNKTARSYEGLNMTFLLCGTEGLRVIDRSELGERYLDCVVVHEMDSDTEEEIGWRVANRAFGEVSFESNGRAEGQHEPHRVEAMRLTGGYVEYLRMNAQKLLSGVKAPDWAIRRCVRLGKFTSYMRSKPPTGKHEGTVQRELSFRLISQLVRLATCLTAVLNKREIDHEVMRRVACVALDTSRGKLLDVTRALAEAGEVGLDIKALAAVGQCSDVEARVLLRFMLRLGVTEVFSPQLTKGYRSPPRWRLTQQLTRLYAEVSSYEVEGD
jgi:hypothetical protein